jgi:hypothetical protein
LRGSGPPSGAFGNAELAEDGDRDIVAGCDLAGDHVEDGVHLHLGLLDDKPGCERDLLAGQDVVDVDALGGRAERLPAVAGR